MNYLQLTPTIRILDIRDGSARMSSLGNKTIIAEKEVTKTELAEAIGVAYTTLADWLKAKTYPRIGRIEEVTDYFGIEKSDLVESKKELMAKGYKIPVLGAVAAGIPIEAIEDIEDWEEISPELAKTGSFFGLRIQGDSMSPRILNGDVVIVKQQEDAETGQIVIATVNGDYATCKKLIKHQSGITLQPLNPSYDPLYFTEEDVANIPVQILRRFVELRGKF